MKRIFQNFQGDIPEFKGLQIRHAKLLVNEEDSSVVVLWFCSRAKDTWYRIFIDGTYCGIDECQTDACDQDLDDGIKVTDVSCRFHDDRVLSATVEDQSIENQICLTIRLKNQTCRLVYDTVSDLCRFE